MVAFWQGSGKGVSSKSCWSYCISSGGGADSETAGRRDSGAVVFASIAFKADAEVGVHGHGCSSACSACWPVMG
jgi:hypothetical protein